MPGLARYYVSVRYLKHEFKKQICSMWTHQWLQWLQWLQWHVSLCARNILRIFSSGLWHNFEFQIINLQIHLLNCLSLLQSFVNWTSVFEIPSHRCILLTSGQSFSDTVCTQREKAWFLLLIIISEIFPWIRIIQMPE